MAAGRRKRESQFHGFTEDEVDESTELLNKVSLRRINMMEEMLQKFGDRLAAMEGQKEKWAEERGELLKELEVLSQEKNELREQNEFLKKQLRQELMEVKNHSKDMQETVKGVEVKQNEWVRRNEEAEKSLKEIMEQQQKEKEGMEKQIVKVIKEKKKLVRDTVEKVKCIMVFGVKEDKIEDRTEREKMEKKKIEKVITNVVEEGEQALKAMEEFHRVGKYEENKVRPIKIKFVSQSQVEEIINGTWRLGGKDEFKGVWINRDLDEEERKNLKELVTEARRKNDLRTEEEKKKFYWRVIDLRLKKRYHKE